jgi:hypothetical protein
MAPLAEKYYNISPYVYCVLNPVKLIVPDDCGPIPRAQNMDYTGRSWYSKTGTSLNNVVASIDNIFVDVINGMIDESAFIYNNGVGAYFKEVGKTYSNMGKSIAADFSRPFSEQIQDLGNVLSSPDFYEDFTANMVMLIAAKSVSTSATGITQAAKTTTVATESTAAKGGAQYTKSSLKLGQQMHKAYKVRLENKITTFKEFRGIKGIRPDFVDLSTKTIYELKPFNPRSIQMGTQQLSKYKFLFEQKYGGTWNTVLDFY